MLLMDASHLVLGSFLGWVWCWVRLHVRAASGRQRYNILGAFNPLTQELYRVGNCTYVNSSTVCELLHQIAAAGITTPITSLLDNARYQPCKLVQDLAQQLHIELLFLPSYSPNLNLIERLWKFVKKEALNSRHNTNFQDFRSAIDDCLDHLADRHKTKVQSLIKLSFQKFENVTLLPQ